MSCSAHQMRTSCTYVEAQNSGGRSTLADPTFSNFLLDLVFIALAKAGICQFLFWNEMIGHSRRTRASKAKVQCWDVPMP